MIDEGRILFRIQHFQESRGGVAVETSSLSYNRSAHSVESCVSLLFFAYHFVDLVQEEHGVFLADRLESLDDFAGHGSDVCSPVSSNLALIRDAAQRDPNIRDVERLMNFFSNNSVNSVVEDVVEDK